MEAREACKKRSIRSIGVETPLIVPSFSSTIAQNIDEIHRNLTEHLFDSSLVSAYDIAKGKMRQDEIWCSNVVFVDSGNYEHCYFQNFTGIHSQKLEEHWTLDEYQSVIDSFQLPLSSLVLVNYDEKAEITNQIESAQQFFHRNGRLKPATDFLCKPLESNDFLDRRRICQNLRNMTDLDNRTN